MLKVLHKHPNPEVLVITPLLTGHTISGETKVSIRRNKVPFTWVGFMSDRNHAFNVNKGFQVYKRTHDKVPPYIQVIDRDIILGRGMLDKLYEVIKRSDNNVGYVYCPFEYKGHINIKFPPMEYDIERLKKYNWISSNSMYKTSVVEKVGGFVTSDKFSRLSDWAMWLRMYKYGYIGKLCSNTSFIAISTKDDISAGSSEEYNRCKMAIYDEFIKPIIQNS